MGKDNFKIIKTLLLFCIIAINYNHALSDTSTLPKGVRAFVYRHISAQVGGKYGELGGYKSYDFNERLTIDTLSGISAKVGEVVTQIKSTSPEIFNNLEIGNINVNAQIDVSADAFAVAYGITDKLMVAVAAPYMNAKVKLSGGYNDSGKIKAAAQSLAAMENNPQYATNKDNISIVRQFLNQLPTIESANLQDILVNYYGYKPLGTWEGANFGDAIAFLQYRFFETPLYKTALKFQLDIPTSGPKDPDNLVAIPLSSGYWGSSLESLNDFFPFGFDNFILSLNPKLKYNWPTTATLRLPESTSFPLTKDKETLTWEPGPVATLTLAADLKTKNKFFGVYSQYTYAYKWIDIFRGNNPWYNYNILAKNTDSTSQVVELGVYVSTVGHFLAQKFPLPLKGSISYSQVLSGVNADILKIWNLGLEMYF